MADPPSAREPAPEGKPPFFNRAEFFYYAVTATLPDTKTRDEFVAWLLAGHMDEVVRRGKAVHGAAIVLDAPADDPDAIRVCAMYTFPSRDAFAAYERDHASALRAEGLETFPPDRGITMRRATGNALGNV